MKNKAPSNETAEDRFKRLANARTKEVLEKLRILGNCSNRQIYSYTEEDVNKIFGAIDGEIKRIKALFKKPGGENFSLK